MRLECSFTQDDLAVATRWCWRTLPRVLAILVVVILVLHRDGLQEVPALLAVTGW